MIFDLRDPGQHQAFCAETGRQMMLYGNAYAIPLGGGFVMLIEPWMNPAAVR